jgi:hypothetical protein
LPVDILEGDSLEEIVHENNINVNNFHNVSDEFDNLKNAKGLKIAHLNVNGLLHKIDQLRLLTLRTKIDILAITESKINSDVTDAEIYIPNYNLLRLYRDRHGGGVAIYCHENLSLFAQTNMSNNEYESLWVKIKLSLL